jgi:hypothetical protein
MPASTVSPPVPVAAAHPRSRPSARGYWVGGTLIALAVIGSILWTALAWIGLNHRIDGFPRSTVPGTAAVHVTDTSTQVLYYESARGITPIPATAIRVTDAAGHAVPVSGYSLDVRYDVPGNLDRVGSAVASFHATEGNYTITTVATANPGTLTIGGDIVQYAIPHLVGAGLVLILGTAGGLTLLVVTAARRASHRPRQAPE